MANVGKWEVKTQGYSFTGRFEADHDALFAVCDHAPLVVHGDSGADAFDHMERAAQVYIQTLEDRREIDVAVERGLLKVISDG